MVESMMGTRQNLLLVSLLISLPVLAETLADPTEPPAWLLSGDAALLNQGPVLQSILRGPGLHAAVINGEKVKVGQPYGDGVLIRLGENEAVLRQADGSLLTLKIDYAIAKTPVSPAQTGRP